MISGRVARVKLHAAKYNLAPRRVNDGESKSVFGLIDLAKSMLSTLRC